MFCGLLYIPDGDFRIISTADYLCGRMKMNQDNMDNAVYDDLFHVYLSKLVYEFPSRIKQQCINWGFNKNFIEIFEDTQPDDLRKYTYSTRAIAIYCKKSNRIAIGFCGIEPMDLLIWLADASTNLIDIGNRFNHLGNIINDENESVRVHAGFYHALGLHTFSESNNTNTMTLKVPIFIKLINFIQKFDRNDDKCEISITGHSLGGALASLFSYVLLAYGYESSISGVYTYGHPLVGNRRYAEILNNKLGNRFHRWINHGDIIPRIPVTQPPSIARCYAPTPYSDALIEGTANNDQTMSDDYYYHAGLRFQINDQGNSEKHYSIDQGPILDYQDELDLFDLYSNSLFHYSRTRRFLWIIIRNGRNEHYSGDYARKIQEIYKNQ